MKQFFDNVVLEDVKCPNGCHEISIKVLEGGDRLHKFPGIFSVYRCVGCGLERTTPRPTAETIGLYYPSEYAPYKEKPVVRSNNGMKQRIAKLLSLHGKELPHISPKRMLEFGCSSGSYMEYARSLGWEVEGIEFSENAAALARDKGFKVQSGAIERAKPPERLYDLIVGWMVLEHLHQPSEVLSKLKDWITADGYLVISVPDRNGLSRHIFGEASYDLQLPTHLFHFDKKSLEKTLNLSGWEVERFFWQRNSNTLLMSLQMWVDEKNIRYISGVIKWLRLSAATSKFRFLLNIFLGTTRQSGRMEVWARPH